MTLDKKLDYKKLAEIIKQGGVGVMPTDTIYGFVCSANNKKSVEKIHRLKQRDLAKKFVILISSKDQIKQLGVELSADQKEVLSKYWPGPNTLVLDAPKGLSHLCKEDRTLALRWPNDKKLQMLITSTGPLIATSVNLAGKDFINDIKKIKQDFPDLDFYIEGSVSNKPSTITRLEKDGSEHKIR